MKNRKNLFRYDWPLHFVLWLTNWLPDNGPFLRLRGMLAAPFLGSCGANLRLGRDVVFYNPSQIHIGRDVYIAKGCWFGANEVICIGDEVQFGPYCVAASSNHTRLNGSFRFGPVAAAPIEVGRGSWIAAHVVLTAGSKVGVGTLVAANAVTHGDLPDHVMAAGLPAVVIKTYED